MWQKMKTGFYRFMQGRYGFDSYSSFLVLIAIVLVLVNLILGFMPLALLPISLIISLVAWALLIYSYVRVFSKNYEKRKKQNDRFLQKMEKLRESIRRKKAISRIKKTHHIYICPGCRQKIKRPKGKGNIVVTCPKCRMEFTKKS